MSSPTRWRGLGPRRKRSNPLLLEDLESRVVLSVLMPIQWHDPNPQPPDLPHAKPSSGSKPLDFGSPTPIGYTPAQIRAAYGINNVVFGTVTGDGTGQTIAIVDAYDDPAFVNSTDPNFSTSDLAQFDKAFGLPDPPSFTKYNETGQTTNLPGTDPAGAGNLNGNWEMEEALDIEWAHAIAPAASIDLVEASNDTNNTDMFTAVATAASLPGVSVVSMSWGIDEYSGQQAVDSTFTTPSGHQGVTFIAASGDQGSPGYYPAYSPNVLAAGGTTLTLNANNAIQSETAWSGSGGGTSQYEPEPAYQQGFQSTGKRTIPDVAWDADPNTGVAMYDSYDNTDGMRRLVRDRRHERRGALVVGPDRHRQPGAGARGRRQPRRADPDPAGDLLRVAGRLQRHHQGQQRRLLGRARLRRGHRPGHAQGPAAGPRAGRLRRGQPRSSSRRSRPAQVIAGDSFGVVVSAEDPAGQVDPAFSGSVTLAMGNDPTGATLGGTLTVTASHGVAVFDGLTINQLGTGYTFTIGSSSFASVTTDPFNIIADPTPGSGTFYPVPTDASLRARDRDGRQQRRRQQHDRPGGHDLRAHRHDGRPDRDPEHLEPAGQDADDRRPGRRSRRHDHPAGDVRVAGPDLRGRGHDRIEHLGGVPGPGDRGGNATNGGILGGDAALGGGLLIDGGTVSLTHVAVKGDEAEGAAGAAGAAGGKAQAPGDGGAGKPGRGGGIYLANGTLVLKDSTISHDLALGGAGGAGGAAAQIAGLAKVSAGGEGGTGASASGGGLYVAGGTVQGSGATHLRRMRPSAARAAPAARAASAAWPAAAERAGRAAPAPRRSAAASTSSRGRITLGGGQVQGNSAIGGAGGQGGSGGAGSSLVATSNVSLTGITADAIRRSGRLAHRHQPPQQLRPQQALPRRAGRRRRCGRAGRRRVRRRLLRRGRLAHRLRPRPSAATRPSAAQGGTGGARRPGRHGRAARSHREQPRRRLGSSLGVGSGSGGAAPLGGSGGLGGDGGVGLRRRTVPGRGHRHAPRRHRQRQRRPRRRRRHRRHRRRGRVRRRTQRDRRHRHGHQGRHGGTGASQRR